MPEAAPAATTAGARAAAGRVLVFRLGGRLLATPSPPGGRIVEVAGCTRVPTAPSWLVGLANDRGTVLSIVDARPLLGLPVTPWSWPLRAQVVGAEALRLALAVEEVVAFEPYRAEEPEPAAGEEPGELGELGKSPLRTTAGPAVVLDLPAIVVALRQRLQEERRAVS